MSGKKSVEIVAQTGRKLGPRALMTRKRLMEATEALLRERSVMDISVVEIARLGETSPATFYHYFKDVEDAVWRLANEIAHELPAALAEIDGDWNGSAGLLRARGLSEAFLDHWERHHAVLLVRNLAADKGDPRFQAARREALSPLLNRLAEIIEEGKKAGRVSRAIHPHVAAAAMMAILERLSAHHKNMRTFQASREDIVETCAQLIYQTLGGDALAN